MHKALNNHHADSTITTESCDSNYTIHIKIQPLIHCGLVMPYVNIDLG